MRITSTWRRLAVAAPVGLLLAAVAGAILTRLDVGGFDGPQSVVWTEFQRFAVWTALAAGPLISLVWLVLSPRKPANVDTVEYAWEQRVFSGLGQDLFIVFGTWMFIAGFAHLDTRTPAFLLALTSVDLVVRTFVIRGREA